jgi:hypothetical protein
VDHSSPDQHQAAGCEAQLFETHLREVVFGPTPLHQPVIPVARDSPQYVRQALRLLISIGGSWYSRATLHQSSPDKQDVFGRESQRLDAHLLEVVFIPAPLHQSAIAVPSEALHYVYKLVGQNMTENRSARTRTSGENGLQSVQKNRYWEASVLIGKRIG